MLRAAGLVGLAAIILTLLVPVPLVSDLATFFALALFVNGPFSPLTPVGFEPILMAYGKIIPPIVVAVVGVMAQLLVEYLNYHLYGAALSSERLRRARESRLMGRVLRWYQAAPFLTTMIVALSPLPYWMVRITASLSRYPMPRHLSATALGRLPRLWAYAALGTLLPFSGGAILAVGLGLSVLLVGIALGHRARAAARV